MLLAALATCLLELKSLGVEARPGPRRGLAAAPVTLRSPVRGVRFERPGDTGAALTVDCALALALARSADRLKDLGVEVVEWVSATSVRNIRGTHRLSRHSFGLALDVVALRGPGGLRYTIANDFERGTGLPDDCVGAPETSGGRLLRTVICSLESSGRFRRILDPDFDGDHWDHLHLEVPAAQRNAPRGASR